MQIGLHKKRSFFFDSWAGISFFKGEFILDKVGHYFNITFFFIEV